MTDANAWEEQLLADMRANAGRPSGGPLAGHPLLVLYSRGARTGERRRAILTYSRDGDAYVVAGTKGGAPTAPAWVSNVAAEPAVTLEIGDRSIPAKGEIVSAAERDELWDRHVRELPWFSDYPAKVGGRIIPMVRLTPTD